MINCRCRRVYHEPWKGCAKYSVCTGGLTDAEVTQTVPKDNVLTTLSERGSTHGDFTENGKVMQSMKALWRAHPGWDRLTPVQCEVLDMIALKVGRVLCGDPNFKDHWHDIAGYAKLAEERCKETSK